MIPRSLGIIVLLGLLATGCGAGDIFGPPDESQNEYPSDCHAPITFTVVGHLHSASGAPVAGEEQVCIDGNYCDKTYWGGCDPPNPLQACADIVVDIHGDFVVDLPTTSPDLKDSPSGVRVLLNARDSGHEAIESTITSTGCVTIDATFVLP